MKRLRTQFQAACSCNLSLGCPIRETLSLDCHIAPHQLTGHRSTDNTLTLLCHHARAGLDIVGQRASRIVFVSMLRAQHCIIVVAGLATAHLCPSVSSARLVCTRTQPTTRWAKSYGYLGASPSYAMCRQIKWRPGCSRMTAAMNRARSTSTGLSSTEFRYDIDLMILVCSGPIACDMVEYVCSL